MEEKIQKSLILHWTFTAFLHQYIGIRASISHKKVNVNKFASNWAHGWHCIKLSLVTISIYYLSVEDDLPVFSKKKFLRKIKGVSFPYWTVVVHKIVAFSSGFQQEVLLYRRKFDFISSPFHKRCKTLFSA